MKIFKNIILAGLLCFSVLGCSTISKYTGGDSGLDLKQVLELAKNNKMVESALGQYGIKLPNSDAPKTQDLLSQGVVANVYYRLKSSNQIISLDDIERVVVINSATPFPLPVPQDSKYNIKINQPTSSLVIPFTPLAPTNAPITTVTNSPPEVIEPPIDTPDTPDAPPNPLDGPDNGTLTVP